MIVITIFITITVIIIEGTNSLIADHGPPSP